LGIFVVALLVMFLIIARHATASLGGTLLDRTSIESAQQYSAVMDWLEKNTQDNEVIWADLETSALIPAYTSNYVLFSRNGNAYTVGIEEIEERYLLSKSLKDFHEDNFRTDYSLIVGYGYSADFFNNHNRKVGFCKRAKMNLVGIDCGEVRNNLELAGKDFFVNITKKYEGIRNDLSRFIKKYNVSYLVLTNDQKEEIIELDKRLGENNYEVAYQDSYFSVYRLNR